MTMMTLTEKPGFFSRNFGKYSIAVVVVDDSSELVEPF